MSAHRVSTKTVITVLLLTLLTIGFAASLVLASDVYLLSFLAILCAVLFANLATLVGRLSPLKCEANLAIVVITTALLSVGTIAFFGLRIEQQIQATSDSIDKSAAQLQAWIQDHPTVRSSLSRVPFLKELPTRDGGTSNDQSVQSRTNAASDSRKDNAESDTAERNASNDVVESASAGWSNVSAINSVTGRVFGVLGKVFATTFGITMNLAFVLFVGVFLAAKPHFYRDGLAQLFPPDRRTRVIEILDDVGETQLNWLQGRAATMLITGVGTGVMLWLLGVPLAITLGVITGVATFVPNIGAIFALVLSTLVAASQGPSTVMWVVMTYAGLQFVESNIITPLIQQHQTSVPPPLLLAAQLMMGVLTGFLGVLVATPLLASAMVLVKKAYIEDVLEQKTNSTDE